MAGNGLKGWTRRKDGRIKWTAANKAKIAKGAQKRFEKGAKKSAASMNRLTAKHNRTFKAIERAGMSPQQTAASKKRAVGVYKAKLQRVKGKNRKQMAKALRKAL